MKQFVLLVSSARMMESSTERFLHASGGLGIEPFKGSSEHLDNPLWVPCQGPQQQIKRLASSHPDESDLSGLVQRVRIRSASQRMEKQETDRRKKARQESDRVEKEEKNFLERARREKERLEKEEKECLERAARLDKEPTARLDNEESVERARLLDQERLADEGASGQGSDHGLRPGGVHASEARSRRSHSGPQHCHPHGARLQVAGGGRPPGRRGWCRPQPHRERPPARREIRNTF